MSITPGQRFTALERFETPEGTIRSIYMEGHTYGVTEQNADFIAAQIAIGAAQLGTALPVIGNRLGAVPAIASGVAEVNQ